MSGDAAYWRAEVERWRNEARAWQEHSERTSEALADVKRLHRKARWRWWQRLGPVAAAWPDVCHEDQQPWPCRTIAALSVARGDEA